MTSTILVFGVSGVGKTTACADFAARYPRVAHFSASDLLRSATGKSSESLRTGSGDQIRANQKLVASELRRRVVGRAIDVVLVDAHSVIDNGKDLVRVPLATIESLNPAALVLLEAPAKVVKARRRNQGCHALANQSLARISAQLKATRESVLEYSQALNLPVVCGTVGSSFQLHGLIGDKPGQAQT